jgi:catechol 2,3-dioxygenase-like lactoylglutathione lyase family enzyme
MSPPDLLGIHHLKFPVADLERSSDFYSRVFGARRLGHLDHYDADKRLYAIILDVPHLGTPLELRLNATQATHQKGFDPVTLKVEGRADLHKWIEHLQHERVPHSPVLTAYVGWLVAFEDPDGRRIRLYTNERHGPELTPSTDPIWL